MSLPGDRTPERVTGARKGPHARVTQKVVVTGKHKIKGKSKGEVVELTMPESGLKALLISGAVEPYTPAPETKTDTAKKVKDNGKADS
jgi:hypothetical protein